MPEGPKRDCVGLPGTDQEAAEGGSGFWTGTYWMRRTANGWQGGRRVVSRLARLFRNNRNHTLLYLIERRLEHAGASLTEQKNVSQAVALSDTPTLSHFSASPFKRNTACSHEYAENEKLLEHTVFGRNASVIVVEYNTSS